MYVKFFKYYWLERFGSRLVNFEKYYWYEMNIGQNQIELF